MTDIQGSRLSHERKRTAKSITDDAARRPHSTAATSPLTTIRRSYFPRLPVIVDSFELPDTSIEARRISAKKRPLI